MKYYLIIGLRVENSKLYLEEHSRSQLYEIKSRLKPYKRVANITELVTDDLRKSQCYSQYKTSINIMYTYTNLLDFIINYPANSDLI